MTSRRRFLKQSSHTCAGLVAGAAEAGHEVKFELAGDGVVLMRTVVADNVHPAGWPPFREALARVVAHGIPIFV